MPPTSLEPLPRAGTLTGRVCASLRRALVEGTLRPGERVMIRDVAAAFGTSPTPAREALMHLVAEGALVVDDRNKVAVPALTHEGLRELVELRSLLETSAAAAAVGRLTERDLGELASTDRAAAAAAAAGDAHGIVEQNAAFHFGIYARAGRPTLLRMIETTWSRLGAYFSMGVPGCGRTAGGFTKHQEIIEALRTRDVHALTLAVEDDIRCSSAFLTDQLDRRSTGGPHVDATV